MLNTYDASAVSVIVGATQIKGFAEGSFVNVERAEDAFTMQTGADGEVTRAATNNKAGTITVTLQQGSDSNDYLSSLAVADEITKDQTFAVLIRDQRGNTLITAESAWVKKIAPVDYSRDAGEREWMIDCASLEIFVGGN